MGGQHRQQQRSGRHPVLISILVLAVLIGLGAGAWWAFRPGTAAHTATGSACRSTTTLRVDAAPEIAPAVGRVADSWNARDTAVDGTCVRVAVSAAASSDVAAVIAGTKGVTVAGLGKPNGTATAPDVWIPDSSTWPARVGASAPSLALTGRSVASSPVVIAVPQPVAATLSGKPAWLSLLTAMSGGTLRPGIVDPNVDASGLLALLAVGQATGAGAARPSDSAQAALVGAMRGLSTGDSQLRDDLLGQFPRAGDQSTLARSLSAAPLPEQSVLAFDAAKPPVPLTALYLDPLVSLDYPYTVLPGLTGARSAAATRFGQALAGTTWKNDLATVDLRATDGTYGAGMPTLPGMPAGPLAHATLPPTAVAQALSTWSAVTVPGRMLAVVDVSGSMAAKVPTAGGATREAVTVSAARSGLGLFDDRWALGLWEFSTDMVGTKPYRQLAPIAPLATSRSAITGALTKVKPIPNGDTGLYDTVLAAYKTVQAGWDPSRVNSVVIMTDGQNDNPGGLTLPQLIAALDKVRDPARPIEVIAIGIGTGVDHSELAKITSTTGGGVFLASDPSMIGQIFLQAIALRPGSAK